jgi:chromosome partitioning protein
MSVVDTATEQGPAIVSVVNLKGGVGKTAISVNFAAYCGRKNYKVLLIDLDPQTNATFSCISVERWQAHAASHGTVANLLGARQHTTAQGKQKSAADVLVKNVFKKVDLIPSHLDLFTIDLDLGGVTARETLLKRAVKDIIAKYDVVICDCPPNLTIPTQNALALSTHYVVPVSPDYLSSLGIALLLSRVNKFSLELECPIDHAGIIMSRIGRPSYFRLQTIESLRQTFADAVFTSEIKERAAVAESAAKQLSIFDMNDRDASREFASFGAELMTRLGF